MITLVGLLIFTVNEVTTVWQLLRRKRNFFNTQVWDIQDQNCLLVLRPKSHKIHGDIQACLYSSISKTIAIATDQMYGLSLKLK